ncbi:toast rack family protein [uncultured Paludibaculum sp.]|uniref:toast rack family protein n=1 Tax=uncultured Paludibaculum sp. TaxID=1765020 RepID=UPI002AAAB6EA|nr:toast rack family protein [uncultured Paludibaculum sp.]
MTLPAYRVGLFAAVLASTGCSIDIGDRHASRTGETVHDTKIIERTKAVKAEMVVAELTIGAGELNLSGGAKELFDGEFTYNVPSWKPEVRYDDSGFRGRLTVRQSGSKGNFGDIKNIWDLKLANDIPLDLRIHCGAGENKLDLHELTLRNVEVQLGAGSVDMDLRGKPLKDYEVRIEGGVGEATVHLPTDVGVVAEAHGGIGSINVRGLKKDGDRWVSESNGSPRATIRLSVKGGIGEINIIAE